MISSSTVARDMSAPVLLLGWEEALLLARSARAAFADFGDFGVWDFLLFFDPPGVAGIWNGLILLITTPHDA